MTAQLADGRAVATEFYAMQGGIAAANKNAGDRLPPALG
jgi:hypothetical protein